MPLDQPIALDTLLAPLQPQPNRTIADVVERLMSESTHPPVYFILTHWWLKLFSTEGGLVSVWAARSLSALFGVAAIPAMFGLGRLIFRSRWAGQGAAALMAVSPYGIYLAQEARHYTLAVLLIIASLSCFSVAVRSLTVNRPLVRWLCLVWVSINGLGVAVHYFFALVLGAEAIALCRFGLLCRPWQKGKRLLSAAWLRLYAVAIGTLICALAWLPIWRTVSDNQLTQWIYDEALSSSWVEPVVRLVSWMITMVALLPVEGVSSGVAIGSGVVVFAYIAWLLRWLRRGLSMAVSDFQTRLLVQAVAGVGAAAIGFILVLTYGLQADLTIAARYQFVYFPVLVALAGGAVGGLQKRATLPLLLLPLLGSLTVVTNFAYQKPDRPDQLVPLIHESQVPVLIATAHQTYEQTRELMGLALEYHRQSETNPAAQLPQFFLAHLAPRSNTAVEALQQTVLRLPRPFDLWTVNFLPVVQPDLEGCTLDTVDRPKMHGYDYRLYHCNEVSIR